MEAVKMDKVDGPTNFEKVVRLADEFQRMSRERLEAFAIAFAKDPQYAFSWGEPAIKAAAQKHVGDMLTDYIARVRANQPEWDDEKVADCIVNELTAELIRKARWPEHSTSQISNLIAQERTAHIAEFVARMSEGRR